MTAVMVERPKSAMQARRSLLIKMFAFVDKMCEYGDVPSEENSYPFQISVDNPEVMHILQAVRNVGQLYGTSARVLLFGVE